MEKTQGLEAVIDDGLTTGKFIIVGKGEEVVLIAKKYPETKYHSHIKSWYERMFGDVEVFGGGIMKVDPEGKCVKAFGRSGSYGPFEEDLVMEILQKKYEGFSVSAETTGEIW